MALFKRDIRKCNIFKTLRALGIDRRFVYQYIELFKETKNVKERIQAASHKIKNSSKLAA